MRQIIYVLSIIVGVSFAAFAQNETLRGDEAVNQLHQTGQYDSLMDAVKAARKNNGQTNEPQPEDAIGQTAKLLAADGAASDIFGFSVALSGDTAIVGAYRDDVGANINQGSAYIFVRSGTTWSQQAQLNALDGTAEDFFGFSVSISGNTAVVGAYTADVGANTDQGTAYIFTKSGTVWTQQVQLNAADGAAFDNFGYSVSISGDTVIIGAYTVDVGANFDQGAAYVYVRNGANWTLQQKLNASDGAGSDNFGFSVSISGETIIVGARFDDVGANSNQGSAYIFTRSGGVWTEQQKLNASDGAAEDNFGINVAISGNTAIVGAPANNVGANADQGAAYVFIRSGTVWTQQQKLTASDGLAGDNFARNVAISGDSIIVGARFNDVGANVNQGSAYIFARSGTVWTMHRQLTAADGLAGDQFGVSVAISGNNILVGAQNNDVGANTDQGAAYVFRVLSNFWTQEVRSIIPDGAESDQYGVCVSISGDTAIVGANSDDVGANANQGSAYVFVRSGTTWTLQQQLNATDGAAGDNFGWSVAIIGDTAIIGSVGDDVGANANQGSAYIFVRNGAVWTQQAQLTASDGAVNDQFGYSVAVSNTAAIIGVNGDDFGANTDQGAAYIFLSSGTIWSEHQKLYDLNGDASDQYGISVSISGNTIIVGARFTDFTTNGNQGAAYVYVRGVTYWSQQQKLTASDGVFGDQFGFSVSISGDTAIVGANLDTTGILTNHGSAYIFVRNGAVWTQQQKLLASDAFPRDNFGYSVSISGDTAIVGAIWANIGVNADQGAAYVYSRNGATWTQQQKLTGSNGGAIDLFGNSVAISGDKIIVGAPFSDASSLNLAPNAPNQGAMFTFVNTVLAPTAANVSAGGRILTAEGNGVRNAIVSLTLANGEVRTTRSRTFGYYNFDDLEAGQTIIVSVISKRFQFTPQVVAINENVAELDFWAK